MEPCISVIVPVYNVEPYLRKCVDSILGQTYQNLEIILVDDGSPDQCPQICEEYARKDPRIRVIHKRNSGLPDARNSAMAIMSGEYVTFVDSDDWIEKEHIYSLYKLIENDCNHVIAVSDSKRVDGNGRILTVFSWKGTDDSVLEPVFGYVWNKLYPVQLLRDTHFEEVRYAEDLLFNLSLLQKKPKFTYSKRSTYIYVLRQNSILSSGVSEKKIDYFLEFIEKLWPALCAVFADKDYLTRIYTHIAGNNMCNFLCDIAVCQEFSFAEKARLSKKIINGVFQRPISWRYANHTLLRLAVVAKTLKCPWLYILLYNNIISGNRRINS